MECLESKLKAIKGIEGGVSNYRCLKLLAIRRLHVVKTRVSISINHASKIRNGVTEENPELAKHLTNYTLDARQNGH